MLLDGLAHQPRALDKARELGQLRHRHRHGLDADAGGEQERDALGAIVAAGGHERAALEQLLRVVDRHRQRVGVCAHRQQLPDGVRLSHHAGHNHGGAATCVGGLDVGAGLVQELGALVVPGAARQHERRDVIRGTHVDRRFGLEQQADALDPVLAASPVERGKARVRHVLGHNVGSGGVRALVVAAGDRVDVHLGIQKQLDDPPLAECSCPAQRRQPVTKRRVQVDLATLDDRLYRGTVARGEGELQWILASWHYPREKVGKCAASARWLLDDVGRSLVEKASKARGTSVGPSTSFSFALRCLGAPRRR